MKYISKAITLAAFAFATAAPVVAQEAQEVGKATEAAQQWLSLADAGRYDATYSAAAPAFQAAITQPAWESAVQGVRKPLGEVKRRTLKSATFQKDLPGAQPGEYVIVVYDTEFAGRPMAAETVVPMRAADGSWKVSGYFVR